MRKASFVENSKLGLAEVEKKATERKAGGWIFGGYCHGDITLNKL